jgi:hypothetical protein
LPDAVNRGTAVMEPCVVGDGSLYFMAARLPGNSRIYRSQLEGGVYLFLVRRAAGAWGEIRHLALNDAKTGSVKPRLGPDHRTLYFLSDRATGTTGIAPAMSNVWRAELQELR